MNRNGVVVWLWPQTWKIGVAVSVVALMCGAWWIILPRHASKKFSKRRSKHWRRNHIADSEHLPPVFPNGWIPVLESSELGVNDVMPLHAFGQELVAFRTADGVAHVLDAYCPHLGAHLGVLGRVVGDCIECPFHGWRFRGNNGACAYVPYARKTPSFVSVKAWTCRESCGLIVVWFHADGEEPSWMIDAPTDVANGTMRQMARYEALCSGHIQDIAQKVADGVHLNCLHAATCLLSLQEFTSRPRDSWLCRLMELKWDAKFAVAGEEVSASLSIQMSLMGWKPKFAQCRGVVRQVGPALTIVTVRNIFGEFVAVVSATPEAPFRTRIVHRSYGRPGLLSWLWCHAAEHGISNMMDRDVAVWNQKTFKEPALLDEDNNIKEFRNWYSQFYSKSSPTWQQVKDKSLSW
ncbi:cholesterol 7-desaturase nvd-like isoform X1 [Dermacentor variabilis]|uniref:cholesterol 7-desaturase nvd-like isoform X1 n=1 Tax=Dermacentor variabilis TaxID=34621 RepID=UPI003F5C7FF3